MAERIETTDVAIVGGGPAGLTLAIELGRRGIGCIVFDEKPGTTQNPQAHATQARTMEHYRRLGFAHEIRALGMPADFSTDMVCCTRLTGYELARFTRPSAKQATHSVRQLGGAWSTPELPHRCCLMFVEPVLHRHASAQPGVEIANGWRVSTFAQDDAGVTVRADRAIPAEPSAEPVATGHGSAARTVRARYLVGCDGPRSVVRRTLGIEMQGESRFDRAWMGGLMLAIYFRAPKLYALMNRPTAWMYFTINPDRRSVLISVNGRDTFVVNAQLKPGEEDQPLTDARAMQLLEETLGVDPGADCPIELISAANWHGGYMLVAERYQRGRVFIAGDAAHLFTPTGGLGYNTAIDDVCNLGWKLAAAVQGWGGAPLLDSYESERRPIGVRNTGLAKMMADRIGHYRPTTLIEAPGAAGEVERATAGAYLLDHLQKEFNIPGVTFGVRYEGSPVVVADGTPPTPDLPNDYVPSARPGGRAPHWWLPDGASLFDRFGRDLTLLAMHPDIAATQPFTAAASALGVPLSVVHLPHAELRELYAADLALIRPDHHVAWRGKIDEAGDNVDGATENALNREDSAVSGAGDAGCGNARERVALAALWQIVGRAGVSFNHPDAQSGRQQQSGR